MFRSTLNKFLLAASLLTCMFCNKDSGILQPEPVKYGKISGKVIHPDNNLLIRVVAEDGIDTATRNPETQMFTFDSIQCGKCILQVRADGYGLFQGMIMLDTAPFRFHDIVLAQIPSQISFIYPSNSQYLDSAYFSLSPTTVSDSGFWVFINFGDKMITESVNKVLTILPDTAGVQIEWTLDESLSLFFPYWKLSTMDTVKVTIGSKALTQWKDTLSGDCRVFFPVDTSFIRTIWQKKI